jgi:predicted O-methyltransferase YrrM
MIDIASGHAAIDRYLAAGYARVPGMSSRFAAAICGHVIRRQTELGIAGDMVEIGTFEGRFFIAMALGLQPGERALGIDVFDWPDEGVHGRLLSHCAAAGVAGERFFTWKGNTRTLPPDGLRSRLGIDQARFVHIDGDHTHESLSYDLELAHHVLHPAGVIALDDMLHPSYPELIVTVLDYLKRHPDMVVVCIVDREDISAAAKFLLCRADAAERYEQDLMASFARFHYIVGGQVMHRLTLVLTSEPKLADIG